MTSIETPFHLHLRSRNARFDGASVAHFGDPQGELAALIARPTLHPLTADGLLRVSGTDAQVFLQGQLSNDVRALGPARAQLTTWCTPQGRMLATFLAWREDGDYCLQLPLELADVVRVRLQRYVLRAQVTLADASASRALLGLAGPGAQDAVAALFDAVPAGPMQTVERAGARAIMLRAGLYQLVVPVEQAADAWDRAAQRARPVGTHGWDWHRIQVCLPTVTAATQDRFTPQMADQDTLGAVSFSKGCYPGQEIVARTQYLGQVKRRLFRVHAEAGAMSAGQDILSEGSVVGTLLNTAPAPGGGSDGLAVLQLDASGRALALRDGRSALTVAAACHAP
jgi:folate-binding protein YgfZ